METECGWRKGYLEEPGVVVVVVGSTEQLSINTRTRAPILHFTA